MTATTLPKFNMDNAETGCCPRFDPTGWDGGELELRDRPFLRATTRNFMHIPLNMGSMMKRTWKTIHDAGAAPADEYLVLSTDPSPWRGEHYFAVSKDVPGAEMTTLPGSYLMKVFEGPYREAGRFRCSDERLNRMWDTTLWTFQNLSLGAYVVDCPQRERMGYGGDAHASTECGLAAYALGAFYTKWSQDWRDVQQEDGNLPYTAPTTWGGGADDRCGLSPNGLFRSIYKHG